MYDVGMIISLHPSVITIRIKAVIKRLILKDMTIHFHSKIIAYKKMHKIEKIKHKMDTKKINAIIN